MSLQACGVGKGIYVDRLLYLSRYQGPLLLLLFVIDLYRIERIVTNFVVRLGA